MPHQGFGHDPVLLAGVVLQGCPPQDHSQFGGSCDGESEGSKVPAWVVTRGSCAEQCCSPMSPSSLGHPTGMSRT